MSLNQIGGQIKSQPLNDNFSYLDGKVDDIAGAGRTTETVKGNADALAAHLAETAADDVHGLLSGGKIIQEVGENANGRYIRFADGTQICMKSGISIGRKTDEYIETTWTFPARFLNNNLVSFLSLRNNSVDWPEVIWRRRISNIYANTTVSATATILGATSIDGFSFPSDFTITNCVAMAIGRWK